MLLQNTIKLILEEVVKNTLNLPITKDELVIQRTKAEFEGDYTLVLFGLVKKYKLNPDEIGEQIGTTACQQHASIFKSFNLLKGFLNFSLQDQCLLDFLENTYPNADYGKASPHTKRVMVSIPLPIPISHSIWAIYATFFWDGVLQNFLRKEATMLQKAVL